MKGITMFKKKTNKAIEKELARAYKDYSKEKERCKKSYPDWRDDQFNMLDDKFIWGYNENPKEEPSFFSWDDAYVYFNRKNKTYYMEVNVWIWESMDAQGVISRLSRIKEAFRNFLIENGYALDTEYPILFPVAGLEAETLTELYVKYKMLFSGYCKYLENNKPQN